MTEISTEQPKAIPKLFELLPGSSMVIAGKLADIVSSLSIENDNVIQTMADSLGVHTETGPLMRMIENGIQGQLEFAALNLMAIPVALGLGKLATDMLGKMSDEELTNSMPFLTPDQIRQIPNKCMGMLGLAWLAIGGWNGLQQFLFHQSPETFDRIISIFR